MKSVPGAIATGSARGARDSIKPGAQAPESAPQLVMEPAKAGDSPQPITAVARSAGLLAFPREILGLAPQALR